MQVQPETIIWNKPVRLSSGPLAQTGAGSTPTEVFRLEKTSDDRINGSIPVWGQPKTSEEKITADLEDAQKNQDPKFASALASDGAKASSSASSSASYGFLDFVDTINPLQHIPIVSTIYRNITGDTIKPISRIVGDAAFGGPIGAAVGIINAAMEYETGKDVGDTVMAAVTGPSQAKTQDTDTTIALANLRSSVPHYNS